MTVRSYRVVGIRRRWFLMLVSWPAALQNWSQMISPWQKCHCCQLQWSPAWCWWSTFPSLLGGAGLQKLYPKARRLGGRWNYAQELPREGAKARSFPPEQRINGRAGGRHSMCLLTNQNQLSVNAHPNQSYTWDTGTRDIHVLEKTMKTRIDACYFTLLCCVFFFFLVWRCFKLLYASKVEQNTLRIDLTHLSPSVSFLKLSSS